MTSVERLLPEWAPQEAIILAWPDQHTDWAPWLVEARQTYLALMQAITANGVGVILLIRSEAKPDFVAMADNLSGVLLVEADYNDTWVRDYGFLTLASGERRVPLSYVFNGWGNKFDARKDNDINLNVLASMCVEPMRFVDMVCEGGALEIDQQGHLLSTALCLQNPERNGDQSLSAYQAAFAQQLGATRVSIFQHGHLEGDDTDGHIDTLVRFTPSQGLVIQSAFNVPQDPHHDGLRDLVEECRQHCPEHTIFELPLPCIVNAAGERLPASYANYLISNGQILFPVYGAPQDQQALEIVQRAHPGFQVVAIDALPLVQQFGSIHCISMQVPKGTLKGEVLAQLTTEV
ncbi:agmatine deiminase family protein [Aestuariibacter halophilus]|uniref:Agmatine deiminase family protein n=1 Tax=Fluctibacter halophilus TaxID=226011 RepID=A0ABS8GAW6_9ALTE|nr:agmatine deiminase family protein [Aestuariibacter halophilus]MCC2617732.1 agmatine deiminase family protein [Aestuariibacter halophilus]